MIYLKVQQTMLNFLQIMSNFFQLFIILQHFRHLLTMTYWKFICGLTNGRWYNPDALKQAYEIVFSRKASATNQETICFSNALMIKENMKKQLGLFLDSKLNSLDHVNEKIKKTTKEVKME